MKHFTVAELDINNYTQITGEVSGGSRPRLTLYHKVGNQKYFFKTYSHKPREVWAECLASHIAELLGLKAQTVTIKTTPARLKEVLHKRYPAQLPEDWQPIGTLARNIFPKNIEITYGSAIVETLSAPRSLEQIEQSIRAKYYAADDLLQDFADMIVFDALIGNMDRHPENWGICEDSKYKQTMLFDRKLTKGLRYFTPLFDHGSSLMFELSPQNIQDMLADEKKLEQYVEKAKFGFVLDSANNKANPFTVIAQHIADRTPWRTRFIKSLGRVADLDLLALSGAILKMPGNEVLGYDNNSRTLLYKSLLLRYNKLVALLESENMSVPIKFILKNESLDMVFGTVTFNGKFVFELDSGIKPEDWQQIGFIPLADGANRVESEDLFYYLNSRLPIDLRTKGAEDKLEYIKNNGLRVASDSYVLIPA